MRILSRQDLHTPGHAARHPWPRCQSFPLSLHLQGSYTSLATLLGLFIFLPCCVLELSDSHHSFSDLLKRHQWVSTQAMAVVMNQAMVQEPQSAPAALSFITGTSSRTSVNTSHSESVEDYYLGCVLVLQLYPVRAFPKWKKQTKNPQILQKSKWQLENRKKMISRTHFPIKFQHSRAQWSRSQQSLPDLPPNKFLTPYLSKLQLPPNTNLSSIK